ncbi:MAG: hypothetical protein EOO43_17895 [Flavobacterium sp.]|nr:MAG: hypothetical protein EOO43_17895 [Flavobacterium sp.]
MNNLAKKGQVRTILISISILLVSLHTIYYYISTVGTEKIISQSVRFLLTLLLLVMVYNGKNWAKILFLVLFSIGILGAFWGLFFVEQDFALKIPFIVMIIVYSISLFHFGFSNEFKAFSEYQNRDIFE